MRPKTPLLLAIDKCYDVFAAYPQPLAMDASPLRNPAEILRELTSAPLRQLGGEQIGPYAGYALTTVGDVEDYRHFLPRILEQAVQRQLWMGTEPPIIGERLKAGEWLSWPSREQEAIRDLFVEAWKQALGEHPDEEDAQNWLCGIAVLDLNVSAALELWHASSSVHACLQLACFVLTGARFVFEQCAEERAYWSYVNEGTIELARNWLLGDALLKLHSDRDRVSSSDLWRIDKALERLDQLRPSCLQ